jgi:8-oxo-dGTP pyrophosphatase MutT (NUDIX family)
MDDVPIRDAATVILIRNAETSPSVLMGQRGKSAVFMPDKFVFPGGRVDREDADIALTSSVSVGCREKLVAKSEGVLPETLAVTAIRELWEETGLILGTAANWAEAPPDWADFADAGYRPDASALSFFFRAVTPPGRPRRFDARFFIAPGEAVANGPDALPDSTDELSHLGWVPLQEVRQLNLAFITDLVLAELSRHLPSTGAPDQVPFVKNDSLESQVIWL